MESFEKYSHYNVTESRYSLEIFAFKQEDTTISGKSYQRLSGFHVPLKYTVQESKRKHLSVSYYQQSMFYACTVTWFVFRIEENRRNVIPAKAGIHCFEVKYRIAGYYVALRGPAFAGMTLVIFHPILNRNYLHCTE
jgi:hypothetical protein